MRRFTFVLVLVARLRWPYRTPRLDSPPGARSRAVAPMMATVIRRSSRACSTASSGHRVAAG